MVSKDKCLDLSVIPQFGGTCWFNAILTIALYSQNVRKVMIKASKKWDKSNNIYMIFKSVLVKYYKHPEKVQKFFNKIRPEIILLKMLKKMGHIFQLEYYKYILKNNLSDLGWFEDFIIPFFKYMKLNTLDIVYSDYKYYLETYNEFTYKYKPQFKSVFTTLNTDYDNVSMDELKRKRKMVFQEINKKLNSIPDILIVRHEAINPQIFNMKEMYNHIGEKIREFKGDTYLFNFNIQGLNSYEDIIYLNGHKYKLDAVTLTNYDIVAMNHAIAGITCNGNHYVYNGWNSATTDPALVNNNYDVSQVIVSPCSLMKYDWNLRKSDNFCLNPKTCKLDFINQQDFGKMLCFSFAKGRRILIYVRVDDKDSELISKGSIPETIKLSNVSDIIKDVHDIKKLSDYELIEALKKFNIFLVPNVKYERTILENLYYDMLVKHYNYNPQVKQSIEKLKTEIKPKNKPQTKNDIIELILKRYPNMKNLKAKNKNELLNILYGNVQIKVKNKTLTKNDLIELVKKKIPALKGLSKLTKAQLQALL